MIGSRMGVIMAPASLPCPSALPQDVLIVEDDPIIALDLEDMILGFGVRTVRTASTCRLAETAKAVLERGAGSGLEARGKGRCLI